MITMELETAGDEFGYRVANTSTESTSDHVVIPAEMTKVTVGIFPTNNGRAYAEYTIGSLDEIMAGTARWEKWPKRNVRRNTHDGIISSVTAVRAVSIQGETVSMTVRGQ